MSENVDCRQCKHCGDVKNGESIQCRLYDKDGRGAYPVTDWKYATAWPCDRFESAATGLISVAVLPTDSQARKDIPLVRGLLDYFPAALAAVAAVSKAGNDKHNPGEEMHHARGKSNDHADCIVRHLVERGTVDPDDGQRHTAKAAWRALALLQEELEAAGAPLARGARLP